MPRQAAVCLCQPARTSSMWIELYPAAANPCDTMASAWPWYNACEMQLVVVLSLQSSVGEYKLQRKISQDIQPIGGVRARVLRADTVPGLVNASVKNSANMFAIKKIGFTNGPG